MKNNITTTREQFFNFIKQEGDTADKALKPTQHYLDYFDKYQATGKKISWNWSALLGWSLWLFYRKMFLYGITLAVIPSLLPIALLWFSTYFFDDFNFFNTYWGIGYFLFFIIPTILYLLYSDYIYLRFANKKVLNGIFYKGVNFWPAAIYFLIHIVFQIFAKEIIILMLPLSLQSS
jgi:hypothetical protein